MEAQIVNSFLDSLTDVFNMFSGEKIEKKSSSVITNPLMGDTDVHIFLGVTGDLQGAIFFSFSHDNGLRLASMMSGMSFEKYDDLATSALQELLNITSGQSLMKFGEMGINADITPPSFLSGNSMELRVPHPMLSLKLAAGDTGFYMNLALKKVQAKRILITDDKPATRELLINIIKKNGYELAGTCTNGAECLDSLLEAQPNIVLMDISMPVMDGLAALEKIKRERPDLKVVMVTAFGEKENVQRAMRLGADGYVLKPFTEKSIITVLRGL